MSRGADIWFLNPDLTIPVTKHIARLLSMMKSRDFSQFQAQEDGEFAEKIAFCHAVSNCLRNCDMD